MAGRHTISRASQLYRGEVDYSPYSPDGRPGLEMPALYFIDFGAPATLDADGLMAAATGTELPNTETVTYTTADNGVSPMDGAALGSVSSVTSVNGTTYSVWTLGTPRNITAAATHATSVVAMTITITGMDEYRERMIETLSIAATGTSQTAAGKKAFKYIISIAVTAAADAEANTLDIGFGDVLGLPVRLVAKKYVVSATLDGAVDTPTLVAAVDTDPATATTGDVRGTVDFGTASNGTRTFSMLVHVPNTDTKAAVFGVAQYGSS